MRETIKEAEKINSNLDSVLDKFKTNFLKNTDKNDPTRYRPRVELWTGPKLNIRPGSIYKNF